MLTLKYRPRCFAEVVGQETIVSILSRQIATKSWKNVYLFTGPAGCGKTTCARIMANEINNGEGSPIEIDAASNGTIDNIRNLIAEAQQSSIDSDYKVFILDECHQLSRAAWDASLKLIEEPPVNSIFIFCTTNPDKIPDTILSRVQRFDFRRVPKDIISNRLSFIMNEEVHKDFEKSALDRIASLADGHMRDAVQLLDKCLDVSKTLTLDIVESTLGLVKSDSIMTIMNGMFNKKIDECLGEFEKIKSFNTNLMQIYDSIVSFAIDCAIFAQYGDIKYTSFSDEDIVKLSKDVELTSKIVDRLVKYRQFVNPSNAETLLKAVFVEICS